MRQYYIHQTPIFVTGILEAGVDFPVFCTEVEEYLSSGLMANVDVVYVGDFIELKDRNAVFNNGAIYMTGKEPTNFDMLENFVHEVAHSLENQYGNFIYDDNFVQEFKGKRARLRSILTAEGYENISPILYDYTEYNKKFDEFLANEVGYPTLLSLTMGLFISPYGATSIQEYFANGFEKYFLDNPRTVRDISPVLYGKVEEIVISEA